MKMSRADRAKQFAPFAALKGYDDLITEQGMERYERIILAEEDAQILSDKFSQIYRGMYVTIRYQGSTGIDEIFGRISEVEQALKFVRIDKKSIRMDDIVDIIGERIVEPKME
jgi:hypothetical protein